MVVASSRRGKHDAEGTQHEGARADRQVRDDAARAQGAGVVFSGKGWAAIQRGPESDRHAERVGGVVSRVGGVVSVVGGVAVRDPAGAADNVGGVGDLKRVGHVCLQ